MFQMKFEVTILEFLTITDKTYAYIIYANGEIIPFTCDTYIK